MTYLTNVIYNNVIKYILNKIITLKLCVFSFRKLIGFYVNVEKKKKMHSKLNIIKNKLFVRSNLMNTYYSITYEYLTQYRYPLYKFKFFHFIILYIYLIHFIILAVMVLKTNDSAIHIIYFYVEFMFFPVELHFILYVIPTIMIDYLINFYVNSW